MYWLFPTVVYMWALALIAVHSFTQISTFILLPNQINPLVNCYFFTHNS